TFTDPDSSAVATDYAATIEWGDGTTTTGSVSGSAGSFSVSGSHTYAEENSYPLTVTISDVDELANSATTASTASTRDAALGGSFVIGDGNATVGAPVTFWGAQWWKDNWLSGSGAPAAFKGFANSPSTPPACGTAWSTGPGNSSGPPAAPLPAFIAVIVASHAEKSGPSISGDTTKVVVVKTNPGYAPNPGHAGTGTVVAVICG